MNIPDKITDHLTQTYHPLAVIVYGSYADGSVGANSDFDALVITDDVMKHDTSVIGGTVLDVFVHPVRDFKTGYDPKEYIRLFDGIILTDTDGIADRLIKDVQYNIDNTPAKTTGEIADEVSWCEKMLARTARGDAEGHYRRHWLLTDSAEIYCDVKGLYYHGPKKTLRYMEQNDPRAFRLYSSALAEQGTDSLAAWTAFLKEESQS